MSTEPAEREPRRRKRDYILGIKLLDRSRTPKKENVLASPSPNASLSHGTSHGSPSLVSSPQNTLQVRPHSTSPNDTILVPNETQLALRPSSLPVAPSIPDNVTQNVLGTLSLWDTAYDDLKKSDRRLIEKYEQLLIAQSQKTATNDPGSSQIMVISDDPGIRRGQMMKILQDGFQSANESRLGAREKTANVMSVVATFKDIIDMAVKASPEASLAWAGVSFCLPLLTNLHTENEAFKEAFGYVTSRAPVYAQMEEEIFGTAAARLSQSGLEDTRLAFLDVYTAVIMFQAEAAKRLYGLRAGNLVKDALQWQGWAELSANVQTAEEKLKDTIMLNNSNSVANTLQQIAQNITTNSYKFCHIFEEALRGMGQVVIPLLDDQRNTAHNQLAIEQQQLVIMEEDSDLQKRILASHQHQAKILKERETRETSERAIKVREAFRIDGDQPNYKFYKDNTKSRANDTCDWFLKHHLYLAWLTSETGPLLVTANPGCGKSVLAKYLIDQELPYRQTKDSMICYFFFKDKVQDSLQQALCALIHQLLAQDEVLIDHAMEYFTDGEEGRKNITSVNVSLEILERIIKDGKRKPITFVVDALDECVQTNTGDDVQRWIQFVTDMFTNRNPSRNFKLIMTSRPYDVITSKFEKFKSTSETRIRGEELMDDLRKEIDKVISLEVRQLGLAKNLEAYLEKSLHSVGNRTYLWVSLIFDNVYFKRTTTGIDEWLSNLPQSVEDYYAKMLRNAEDIDFMRTVFCLILVAKTPLKLRQISEAISARSGYPTFDLESDEDFKTRIHRECGLFVVVQRDVVDFIHLTAREFLLARPKMGAESSELKHHHVAEDSSTQIRPHSITVHEAHRVVANCCLTFLTMPAVQQIISQTQRKWLRIAKRECWNEGYFVEGGSQPSSDLESEDEEETSPQQATALPDTGVAEQPYKAIHLYIPDLSILLKLGATFKFHRYAGRWWHYHVLQSGDETLQFDPRTQSLCGSTTLLPCAWRGLLFSYFNLLRGFFAIPQQNTTLWYFSSIGFLHAVRANIQGSCGRNLDQVVLDKYHATDCSKAEDGVMMDFMTTPLWQAVYWNHDKIVEELLKREANPSSCRPFDQTTPLHVACSRSNLRIVKLLLQANAQVNLADIRGDTAVHTAVRMPDSYACLELLVQQGASIDIRNARQATPLHFAAESMSVQAIKLLLGRGADVFAQDSREYTLLHRFMLEFDGTPTKAVKSVFCRLLEERKPDGERLLDIRNSYGSSPLLMACRLDQTELGIMLLEKGADIYLADIYERQPLHYACFLDDDTLLKAILEKHDNVNVKDEDGITPLVYAVVFGRITNITHLLEKGAQLDAGDLEGNHLESAAFLHDNATEILRALHITITDEQVDKCKETATEEEEFWRSIKEVEYCD